MLKNSEKIDIIFCKFGKNIITICTKYTMNFKLIDQNILLLDAVLSIYTEKRAV